MKATRIVPIESVKGPVIASLLLLTDHSSQGGPQYAPSARARAPGARSREPLRGYWAVPDGPGWPEVKPGMK